MTSQISFKTIRAWCKALIPLQHLYRKNVCEVAGRSSSVLLCGVMQGCCTSLAGCLDSGGWFELCSRVIPMTPSSSCYALESAPAPPVSGSRDAFFPIRNACTFGFLQQHRTRTLGQPYARGVHSRRIRLQNEFLIRYRCSRDPQCQGRSR
jgi:hypothetical protein